MIAGKKPKQSKKFERKSDIKARQKWTNMKITGFIRENPTNWSEKEFEYIMSTKIPEIKGCLH